MLVGLFVALIVVLALLAFFSPIWFVFAILGFVLGWVVRCVVRKWKQSKGTWILSLLAALGIMIVGALLTELKHEPPLFIFTHEVPYTAMLSYRSPPRPWQLREEITVAREKWLEFGHSPSGNDTAIPSSEAVEGRKNLIASEWTTTGMVGAADRFERTRDIKVSARWFPATTVNKFDINILTGAVKKTAHPIVPAADSSSVVIQTPRYIVGATFPASDSRANTLEEEQERLTVPLKTTRLESHEVRFQVLSPLLHWHFGQQIATMSAFSGIEWLWLLIFGGLQKRISEGVLEPILGRWIPGKKSPTPDPDEP